MLVIEALALLCEIPPQTLSKIMNSMYPAIVPSTSWNKFKDFLMKHFDLSEHSFSCLKQVALIKGNLEESFTKMEEILRANRKGGMLKQVASIFEAFVSNIRAVGCTNQVCRGRISFRSNLSRFFVIITNAFKDLFLIRSKLLMIPKELT